jgi:alanine dehydrogenase
MKIIQEIGAPSFTNDDVRSVIEKIGWERFIKEIRKGFEQSSLGKADTPHKIYVNTPFESDMRCMPAYLTEYKGGKYAGVKVICVVPKNIQRQMPCVLGEYLLRDAETMQLLAVMKAEELTAYRTGAATAVATDVLALKGAKTMCMIGAGKQAYYQAKGILAVRPSIEKIKVFDLFAACCQRFKNYEKEFGVDIEVSTSVEDAIKCADVITTVTPATVPFISHNAITSGMHMNGVGADSKHKIEFDPHVLKKSKVFVDDMEQCINSGEVYQGLEKGMIDKSDLIPIGDVLIGKEKGRTSNSDITFFKSTGVAHEDLITAILVYEHFKKQT